MSAPSHKLPGLDVVFSPAVLQSHGAGFLFTLCAEVVLTLTGALQTAALATLLCQSRSNLHPNTRSIAVNIAAQFPLFHTVPRLVEIWLILRHSYLTTEPVNTDYWTSPILWADVLRVYLLMLGGFTLPAMAIERAVATLFVRNYEAKQKRWLAVWLVLRVDLVAVAVTIGHEFGPVRILIGLLVSVNIPALMVSLGLAMSWY